MINRDFLNLKTTNQGGKLGIRMSVEGKKNYKLNKGKKSYTGAIIKSILIGFWQHFYSFCVYLRAILCVMSVERNPITLSFYSDRFLSEIF